MSSWFIAPPPRPQARLTLFCVPHAGRGASLFFPWRREMADWAYPVAVQLPGRESRLGEPPLRRISAIAAALATEIAPRLNQPYVLFGHSMGALVCFELARALRRHGLPAPAAMVLSGRRAPTAPSPDSPIHALDDTAFIDAMCARYNGIPQVILDHPEMLAMLLPIMRADLEAVETHAYEAEAPLEVPFLLYGGREDPQVTPQNFAGWQALSAVPARTRLFAGGHFYLQDERAALIAALQDDLAPFVPGEGRG